LNREELFHDVNPDFNRGGVGLGTYDTVARFKDIVITTPDGKDIWRGLPDLSPEAIGKGGASVIAVERSALAPVVQPQAPPAAQRAGNKPVQPRATQAARSPSRTAHSVSGKWRVEGNDLVKTDASEPGEIRFGDPSWSSYNLSFKVIGTEGHPAYTAKFHYQSSRDHCLLEIGDDRVKNITYFYCHHKGGRSEILDRRHPIQLGRAYDVRLIVRGPLVTIYLDGQEWFDNVNVPLTEGRIGFATDRTIARFRDIVITTPEGKPLWNGPPDRIVDAEGKIHWEAPANERGGAGAAPDSAVEGPIRKPLDKPALTAAMTAATAGDLLPAGDSGRGAEWAYTTSDPGPRWAEPNFDDRKWSRGQMGFGAGETALVVHTAWNSRAIWLRARVFVPALAPGDILKLRQGPNRPRAAVFVNGRRLYHFQGGSPYYDYPLAPPQKALFGPGENVIAVTTQHGEDEWNAGPKGHGVDLGLTLSKGDKDAETRDGRFLPLFNGQDLSGWDGLKGYWRIEGAALIGSPPTKDRRPTTFLVSQRKYRDFELRFKARLKDNIGNSGVQFRSELRDEKVFRVRGFQCDIASPGPDRQPGSVYSEGTMLCAAPGELVSESYRKNDFNKFSIKCIGKHVTIMVNDYTVVDRDFTEIPDEGVIAWEFHGGLPPKEVVFKDAEIRELGARR
jgi:hypothetical protein